MAGFESAVVAGEFAGLEFAVGVELDESGVARGISEGVPGATAAKDALDSLIFDEVDGVELAVAVEGGRGAAAAEVAGAADPVSGEDGLAGYGDVMCGARRPEFNNGAAGDAEVAEVGGPGELALIQRAVGIEPSFTAGAGVTLDGGVAYEFIANGVGFGRGADADRGNEEQAEQQQCLLHG